MHVTSCIKISSSHSAFVHLSFSSHMPSRWKITDSYNENCPCIVYMHTLSVCQPVGRYKGADKALMWHNESFPLPLLNTSLHLLVCWYIKFEPVLGIKKWLQRAYMHQTVCLLCSLINLWDMYYSSNRCCSSRLSIPGPIREQVSFQSFAWFVTSCSEVTLLRLSRIVEFWLGLWVKCQLTSRTGSSYFSPLQSSTSCTLSHLFPHS